MRKIFLILYTLIFLFSLVGDNAVYAETTGTSLIPAPSDLLVYAGQNSDGSYGFTASWYNNHSGSANMYLKYSGKDEHGRDFSGYASFSGTGPGPQTYTTTKEFGGFFEFKVQACDYSSNCSDYSNTFQITVGNSATTLPAMPTNFSKTVALSATGENILTLTWKDVSSNEDNFRIYAKMDGDADYSLLAVKDAGATSHIQTPVPAGTHYYKIKACNSAGCSDFTEPVNVILTGDISISKPIAPSNLSVSLASTLTDVEISWVDNSDNEDRFEVWKSINGGVFLSLGFADKNITQYRDTSLSVGAYAYKVKACNSMGCSAFSNIEDIAVIQKEDIIENETIVGFAKDSNGNIITGKNIKIFAVSDKDVWKETEVNLSTGTYSLSVVPGVWYLGYHVESSTGFLAQKNEIKVEVGSGESVSKDIVLTRSGSTLRGKVYDPENNPVSGAMIAIGKTSFSGATTDSSIDTHGLFVKTNSSGFYSVTLPAGTYFVKTFVDPNLNFIAPPEKEATLIEGRTLDLDLYLRQPLRKITGRVYVDNNLAADAFVWAWSESGGYREGRTNSNGIFELLVNDSDKWRIASSKKIETAFYRSGEYSIDVTDSDVARVLYLEKRFDLLGAVSETNSTSTEAVVEVSSGPKLIVPANVTTTSSSLEITVAPDEEAPSQGFSKVVGAAYKLEARDLSGSLVTNFNNRITISMPYNTEEVAGLGSSEDDLALHFWDEATGTWQILTDSIVNKTSKTVTATTDHFTRFAVLTVVPVVDVGHILDGDLITTANSFDVYIAKKVGNKKFKRLILNPEIFNSYGHLSWNNIKTVTQAELDEFVLSGLTMEIYADGTPVNGQVYQVSSAPNSDIGISSKVQMSPAVFEAAGYDWDGIFKINHTEASPSFYPEGAPITG